MSSAATQLAGASIQPRAGNVWLLGTTCLLVAAATIAALRFQVGGLSVPLHVAPVLLALPFVLPAFNRFPRQLFNALLVFFALFAFSVIRYGSEFGDLVKMATSVLTIVAVALMVGRREHFVTGTVALALSLLIANANGIRGGFVDYVGYMPMGEIANKNAFSLYVLPIVLLSGFTLLHFPTTTLQRALLSTSIVSSAFILFTGANRSGWGGMLLIAVMLAIQTRKWRAALVVAVLAVASYGVFIALGNRETFDHRVQQTTEGYASDEIRRNLFTTALEIGVENPVFGITPQELRFEMARRLGSELPMLDTHNFVGYIVAGSGFPALLALAAIALILARRPANASPQIRATVDLLRMLVALFLFRGFFSREIFFVGPFPISLGLSVGLLIACAETHRKSAVQRASQKRIEPSGDRGAVVTALSSNTPSSA